MCNRNGLIPAFILLLLVFNVPGRTQTDTTIHLKKSLRPDSSFISDYTHLLTARCFILFQDADVLSNPGNIEKIIYRPNVNLRIGIAGFYKWFGLALSLENFFSFLDKEIYGSTSSIDLRINGFGRRIAGEAFFQKYTGFFIQTPKKDDGTYYLLPDMSTFSIGLSGYWIYNPERFSIRAAFIQTERQKKSAGSLLVRPFFLYYQITSDQGIIPGDLIRQYNIPASKMITQGEFYAIGLSPGYNYTWVFLKNFYVSCTIFPGVAAQFYNFKNATKTWNDFEFSFKLGGRIAAGYNSDKWFIGGSVQTSFNQIPDRLSNTLFDYDVSQIRIWAGTRFNLFKKKKSDTFVTAK